MKTTITLLFLLFMMIPSFGQESIDSVEWKNMLSTYDSGDLNKCLKLINTFLGSKKDVKVYVLKSELLIELKKYTEAKENYEMALKNYPNSFDLNINYGILLNGLSINDRAIDHITNAIDVAETDQEKSSAYTSRAVVLSSVREFQDAYDDLHTALGYDSNNIATLVNFGAVCDEIGKTMEGIMHLKKAVELEPNFAGGYANIGYLLQELGDYTSAITYYDKVLELDPKEPLGFSNRAYNYLMIGDTKQALKDINKSIQLYPNNSYAYMVKGLILIETGKKKDACVEFETALNLGFTEQYGDRVVKTMREHCK